MQMFTKRIVGLILVPAFVSTGCSTFNQKGGIFGAKDKQANTTPNSATRPEDAPLVKYRGEKQTATPKMLLDFADYEFNAKQYDRAEQNYHKAIEKDPKLENGYVGLSKVHLAKDDPGGALTVLQTASQQCPNSAAIHNEIGVCKAKMNDFATAQREMEKAVQLEATNKLYVSNLAGVQAMRGDYDKAYETYVKAFSPAEANYKIAGLAQAQGKDEEGMRRLRLALISNPQYRPAMDAMERYYDRDVQPAKYSPRNDRRDSRDLEDEREFNR